MDAARISTLLAPFLRAPLTQEQLAQVSNYLDLLLRWNQKINLTALRQPEEIITRHFGESFFLAASAFRLQAEAHPVSGFQEIMDLGSGAGFPGLPLKIYAPETSVTLIESRQKKAAFLNEVIRSLALTGVRVFHGRAEEFAAGSADLVTLRAVEKFATVLPIAAGLLRPGGCLALLVGAAQMEAACQALPALVWSQPVPLPRSRTRVLLVGTNPKRHESSC